MFLFLSISVYALLQSSFVAADFYMNCTYSDAQGEWIFYVDQEGHDNTINCTQDFANNTDNFKNAVKVDLQYPDIAVDDQGNIGFWTIILNECFEVVIGGKKFFAFFKYESYPKQSIHYNYCGETATGWVHDIDGSNWGCYVGKKTTLVPRRETKDKVNWTESPQDNSPFADEDSEITLAYVNHINRAHNTWSAKTYPEFAGRTLAAMTGGKQRLSMPKVVAARREELKEAATLPENFDWRSVNGVNYVSPVRYQDECGSCYAFNTMAMIESRIRIMTNNTFKPIFSPQDVVDCNQYTQGCDGGFSYTTAKYAEDFGFVEESCNEYKNEQSDTCTTSKKCRRYYTTGYEYIGGYYGACNEPLMRLNLYKYGPITVGYQMHIDFTRYKSGIYKHTKALPESVNFNPYVPVSHGVVIVGYGTDRTNPEEPIDYWICKNSWGTEWGENGYFRIVRGVNECGIESIALQAFPVLTNDML